MQLRIYPPMLPEGRRVDVSGEASTMALTLDAADEDKINRFTAIARHRALIRPILGSYQSITTQAEGFQLWGGRTG